ncbi:hypothetical protein B0J15DRAFT_472520 [Fusarium solani]|uniref:Uncharacterized protein n=1 Tax=Fusarium solani TaxID=169388 RepID=A0A9P9G6I4_FUSSL|nr:uncharacterized protein B0J15DRAFT_472520 [Fusarium solani]KAH7232117.1 hypothetical protein B0J15DRAFT_472520 [Fusarium solani]
MKPYLLSKAECSGLLNGYLATPEGAFEPARKVHLDHICVPTCREALVNFRPKVEEACNTTKYAVAFHYGDMIFAQCEDCTLGQWMKQLQAPIRYHNEGASKFSKATSACGATGYEYVKPTTQYISQLTMYMETWLDNFIPPTPTPTP